MDNENMDNEVEKLIVKYTRKIHPQDLGIKTQLLEQTLRVFAIEIQHQEINY